VVNAHIYSEQLGEQKTICLGLKEVENHKSESIYRAVSELLTDYGQNIDNIGLINTDNASSNLKAFRYE